MNLLSVLAKLSSMTMLSRVLGFVRDAVLARIFGAGMAMDAFVVAFRLPNLLRRIFAEGAFSQAFVPILADYKQNQSPENTQQFVQYVAGMLSFVLCIVTAIGVLAAPAVIWLTASGLAQDGTRFDLAVDLLRVVFPYILLISLSSFVGSILNTYSQFSIPAFTPVLLNVSFIVFAVFFVPYFDPPIMALGWAVLVGGLLQLGFQLPWLFKLGFLKMPKLSFRHAAVNRVIKQMIPSIIGSSAAQISLVINTIFASYLVIGSVSWMYYADRLMELPSGVIGAALGTILLPNLSKHAAAQNQTEFSALLDWGLRLCLLLILPAAAGLAVLGFPLVATLFMYNQFSLHDAQMTQYALLTYAFGLPAMIMPRILASGFYAQKNVKTPTKIALISLATTQLFNLLLVWHWQHIGLTMAISLGAWANATLLFGALLAKDLYTPREGWRIYLTRIVIALLVMSGGLWVIQIALPINWQAMSGIARAGVLGGLIVLAMILYFGVLIALGWRVRELKRTE
ncbi:murein biosynthesis integral membrane protein MurJ [Kingella kingae]|uniref:murein biosynthesis integral membrane protein MurJ n=1 Tax=Kingella kingae TaxID=504 RepID=UPI0003FAB0FA|nr:murein biosynthesis integral membrane protein MurJ [Kingella kingae]MDK4624760.1 murein biosynthesis integral membrane protein MurJ [Kingella kingae]MDK4660400.1 murein biosynthesis integral membrane protein MurJ [Kingella kingae]MDK4668380.1 murein biosynthesis integral membrane protein MurJ [Kingella kingae]MDK4686670.1 murein biosynthesis integral membrane protein MurJ [Kingella kingae]